MADGKCEIQTGFFLFNMCGEHAVGSCCVCSKELCMEHAQKKNGSLYCPKCLDDLERKNKPKTDDGSHRRYHYHRSRSRSRRSSYYNDCDDYWLHSYRSDFQKGYKPVRGEEFGEKDMQGFNANGEDPDQLAESFDDDANAFDS